MKRKIFSAGFLFLLLLMSLFVAKVALAEYPEHRIKLIVAYPPGGGTDLLGRAIAEHINPYLAGKVYVENVPGAGSAIGAREVSNAAPDGYTLLLFGSSNVIGPNLMKNFPPFNLFDPICVVNMDLQILVVKADGRFKTLEDVVSYARLHPGEVTITSVGVGSVDHFAIEAFMSASGTKLTVVPTKGTGPSLMAALGGHVDVAITAFAESASLFEGKKLTPLAVLGSKRSAYLPDVRTVKELGYNMFTVMFRGVAVRKETPDGIKRVLDEAFRKAAQSEEFKKALDKMRIEPTYLGPIEATTFINEMGVFYKGMAAKMGLKPE